MDDKKEEKESDKNEIPFQKTPDSLKDFGSLSAGNARERFYCLSIIGQIEGHYILDEKQKTTKYEHLIPLLVSLEESDEIDGILVLLNTVGGDVEAGLAIAEVIAGLRTPCVSVVLGGGHSIGVPLAVSARRSFIVKSATMTIHPVRTSGTLISVPQTFDYLRKMQDRILDFVVEHSHVARDVLYRAMMKTDELANDVGSVLSGKEAVDCGLIDEIGGVSEALDALRALVNEEKRRAVGKEGGSVGTEEAVKKEDNNPPCAAPLTPNGGECCDTGKRE